MLMFCGSRSAAGSPVPPLLSCFLLSWLGGGVRVVAGRRVPRDDRVRLLSGVCVLSRVLCVVIVNLFVCLCVFVVMSVRWMPWHWGPMKDVVACDIPRGAGLRAVIRGFPNGGTRRPLWGVTRV